jgi:ABC-type lipoprotein export system ATPase subunit
MDSHSSTVLVSAEDLRKSFGPVEVLRGVSFTIGVGERVGIVGPSGAGKSTLLHLLGLLTFPSGGALSIGGRPVGSLSDEEGTRFRSETIGFLFQSHHLLPDLSLLENVMIPLLIRRVNPSEAASLAQESFGAFGVGASVSSPPGGSLGGRAADGRPWLGRSFMGRVFFWPMNRREIWTGALVGRWRPCCGRKRATMAPRWFL